MLADLEGWMEAHGYDSLHRIYRIMSQKETGDPDSYERAQYIRIIGVWRS
ncbi:MAG: hypothetical protein RDV48_23325 [Candidatus Eremiobacteraeota bacterium]|nr:hypothetical protein [Candidatus Eremiobacteraeota bacterium]